MSEKKEATPRVQIRAWLPTQTQQPRDLPPTFFVLGPNGDEPSNYGKARPVRLTKQNIAAHAGLVTVIKNISVTYQLPWAPGEERTLVIPRLQLKGHTRTWPRQIVDQVESLKRLELTKEAFREAKNNLSVRDALSAWLPSGEQAGGDPTAEDGSAPTGRDA
jgi:hypothetical protein